jgi:hypothetical protein
MTDARESLFRREVGRALDDLIEVLQGHRNHQTVGMGYWANLNRAKDLLDAEIERVNAADAAVWTNVKARER